MQIDPEVFLAEFPPAEPPAELPLELEPDPNYCHYTLDPRYYIDPTRTTRGTAMLTIKGSDDLDTLFPAPAVTRAIAVLEPGDDVREVPDVGLPRGEGGLLAAPWELVIRHPAAYEVIVLYSTDHGVAFICPDEPWLDPDLREALEDELSLSSP